MPRSKTVDAQEVQQAVAASLDRLLIALLRPLGRRKLREYANQCALQWECCQFILSRKRSQLERMFRVDPASLGQISNGPRMTAADLRVQIKIIDNVTAWLTGETPLDALSYRDMGRLMIREGSRTIGPRTFKREFVQAFEAREWARTAGQRITQKELAQRFTPRAYERNPESALRAMGNGLKRIERDRLRLDAEIRSRSLSLKGKTRTDRTSK